MLNNDYEGSRTEFLKLLAEQGEEPAFVTRRRRLDATIERLRWTCRTHRKSLADGPRLHLRRIASMIGGDWSKLGPFLAAPSRWGVFQTLSDELDPFYQLANGAQVTGINWTSSSSRVQRLLKELRGSIDRFNGVWIDYLAGLDLTPVNQTISDYNEYYVIEKACAFGREDIAARGFEPIDLLDHSWLESEFPPIDLPQLRKP